MQCTRDTACTESHMTRVAVVPFLNTVAKRWLCPSPFFCTPHLLSAVPWTSWVFSLFRSTTETRLSRLRRRSWTFSFLLGATAIRGLRHDGFSCTPPVALKIEFVDCRAFAVGYFTESGADFRLNVCCFGGVVDKSRPRFVNYVKTDSNCSARFIVEMTSIVTSRGPPSFPGFPARLGAGGCIQPIWKSHGPQQTTKSPIDFLHNYRSNVTESTTYPSSARVWWRLVEYRASTTTAFPATCAKVVGVKRWRSFMSAESACGLERSDFPDERRIRPHPTEALCWRFASARERTGEQSLRG